MKTRFIQNPLPSCVTVPMLNICQHIQANIGVFCYLTGHVSSFSHSSVDPRKISTDCFKKAAVKEVSVPEEYPK
jgi:hypothetical protein